jgi:monoamine oxidase
MNSEIDIVIVGAGAAGIGAARRLVGCGLSVSVLEALPRIGGRAWTLQTTAGPLDLGCGWLHSADRNPWARMAEDTGFVVHRGPTAWGEQFRDLGFSPEDQEAAGMAFGRWADRISAAPPASDRASDALDPGNPWSAYLQALSGYINGDELERISAADYAAYAEASTNSNWRIPDGYGTLIASAMPAGMQIHLDTSVEGLSLAGRRIDVHTPKGRLRARAVILTISTHVLAGSSIALPPELDAWRDAACRLPLGNNEKLFLEIVGNSPFAPESHVLGNPRNPETGTYYIRPFGRLVIECFLGGAGARVAAARGADAAFAQAVEELAALFGSSVRRLLRPLAASRWSGTASIGGGYSHALPGYAQSRLTLGRPFEDRVFFAGEATSPTDFSTAHGAYQSGLRAAEEVLASLAASPR